MESLKLTHSSLCIALMVLITNFWSINSKKSEVYLTTKSGVLRGTTMSFHKVNVWTFLGIPYAKPPTGDLRFKKPEPVEPWLQTLDAMNMPPACLQYPIPDTPSADTMPGQSENCLFLNIWVPQVPNAGSRGLVVMFWIHGGVFVRGSNRLPVYNGKAFAAVGNVVVVTVNYRLGSLGFLYSGTKDAPGNMGLYDILQALQWVNDNIEAFGGDRHRITMFGQSVGSVTVSILHISPLAQNLFQRGIMESGAVPYHVTKENNNENFELGQILASRVHCSNETFTFLEHPEEVICCLRGISASAIVNASTQGNPKSAIPFKVIYGDSLLPHDPRKVILNGHLQRKDLLMGVVADEGAHRMTLTFPDVFGMFGEKNPKINKSYGEALIRKMFSRFPEKELVVQLYLDAYPDDDYDKIREQVHTSIGDFEFVCPTVYFAEKCVNTSSKVYFYLFRHRPTPSPYAPWMKFTHMSEVEFVFGQPLINRRRYKEVEESLSLRMIKIWTNFAKTGYPGEKWPRFNRALPTVRLLDTGSEIKNIMEPHQHNCDFFWQFFDYMA